MVAKQKGIYIKIEGTTNMTTEKIIKRVIQNKEQMAAKYDKGKSKEGKYEEHKEFMAES